MTMTYIASILNETEKEEPRISTSVFNFHSSRGISFSIFLSTGYDIRFEWKGHGKTSPKVFDREQDISESIASRL